MAPLHTKANRPKEPEQPNNSRIKHKVETPLQILPPVPRRPVKREASREDRKVEGRIVVVHVGDTCHDDEGDVVQYPADDGVDAGEVDEVNFGLAEVGVAALPADEVEDEEEAEEGEGGEASPVDKGVAEEEVLDDFGHG